MLAEAIWGKGDKLKQWWFSPKDKYFHLFPPRPCQGAPTCLPSYSTAFSNFATTQRAHRISEHENIISVVRWYRTLDCTFSASRLYCLYLVTKPILGWLKSVSPDFWCCCSCCCYCTWYTFVDGWWWVIRLDWDFFPGALISVGVGAFPFSLRMDVNLDGRWLIGSNGRTR